jgi:pyruvate dehydrogenase E1 component alpha subunit/2-oxoisovalerate dehydrogenase E1 component
MHLFDATRRFYGGYAIVGGGLPIAVGLALADKMQKRQRVTACFFGDGAVAEGEFHESLNLAALWKLPVIFLCENNLYAMGTALERHQAQKDITLKARAEGVQAEAVDGMDVIAVEAATRRAAGCARERGEPFLIEFQSYRFRAHSMYDAELYRSKEEVEQWKKRCPVANFIERLRGWGALDQTELDSLESRAAREIDEAIAFAEKSEWEPVENLMKEVYTIKHG